MESRSGNRSPKTTRPRPRAAQDARYPITVSATTTRRATARASGITCTCRTVKEVIDAAKTITGRDIPIKPGGGAQAIPRCSSRAPIESQRRSGGIRERAHSTRSCGPHGRGKRRFRGTTPSASATAARRQAKRRLVSWRAGGCARERGARWAPESPSLVARGKPRHSDCARRPHQNASTGNRSRPGLPGRSHRARCPYHTDAGPVQS
jgi:hypothetical protein